MKPIPALNVNLAKCTCPAGWPAANGGHWPGGGPNIPACPAEPIRLPCRLPGSVTFRVASGECDCGGRTTFHRTTHERSTMHMDSCPASPIRITCSITSPDGSWEKSGVSEVDWPDGSYRGDDGLALAASARLACARYWELVKALVAGKSWAQVDTASLDVRWRPLFAQRDAVFSALAKAHRAEDALIEALGGYEEAMRGAPVGIYGLKRESHGALERYVNHLIEQVGAL